MWAHRHSHLCLYAAPRSGHGRRNWCRQHDPNLHDEYRSGRALEQIGLAADALKQRQADIAAAGYAVTYICGTSWYCFFVPFVAPRLMGVDLVLATIEQSNKVTRPGVAWETKFMRVVILLAATLVTAYCVPAWATVRITSDAGGQLGPYLEKLQSLRESGQSVIIDGACLSACTMVLGLIPRDRVCVTSRARLGFHAAWRPDGDGRQTLDRDGTELLMSVYPQPVRDWINRRGGLSRQLIYLSGGELASMYPRCNAATATATADWRPGREHGPGGVGGPSAARAATIRSRAR